MNTLPGPGYYWFVGRLDGEPFDDGIAVEVDETGLHYRTASSTSWEASAVHGSFVLLPLDRHQVVRTHATPCEDGSWCVCIQADAGLEIEPAFRPDWRPKKGKLGLRIRIGEDLVYPVDWKGRWHEAAFLSLFVTKLVVALRDSPPEEGRIPRGAEQAFAEVLHRTSLETQAHAVAFAVALGHGGIYNQGVPARALGFLIHSAGLDRGGHWGRLYFLCGCGASRGLLAAPVAGTGAGHVFVCLACHGGFLWADFRLSPGWLAMVGGPAP